MTNTIEILKYPHHTLTHVSTPIETTDGVFDKNHELYYLVPDLFNALMSVQWGMAVGFAAPQIGVNKRVFIPLGEVYVNPEVLLKSVGAPLTKKEGCYSLQNNNFCKKTRPY